MKKALIEHAAPTLAGLKTANMFNYIFDNIEKLEQEVLMLNQEFNTKGLYFEILRRNSKTVLLYVYRKKRLVQELKEKRTIQLLHNAGYDNVTDVKACLEYLKQRLESSDQFPHEIGVFLGYPIEDVLGFINNCGMNCKCCGYWKVYGDEKRHNTYFVSIINVEKFIRNYF